MPGVHHLLFVLQVPDFHRPRQNLLLNILARLLIVLLPLLPLLLLFRLFNLFVLFIVNDLLDF